METINVEIKFKIALLCAIVGFLIGLTAVDIQDLAKSDDLGLSVGLALIFGILGFSVLPLVIFEFANSYIKLYLLCGPIGIAFIKLSIKIFTADQIISKKEISIINLYMQKEFGHVVTDPLLDYISENKKVIINIKETCKPLAEIKLAGRIDILYRLFLLRMHDRMINDKEESLLKLIAKAMKIGERRFEMVKNNVLKEKGYYTNSGKEQQQNHSRNFYIMDQLMKMAYNPYLLFGLDQNASNEEVKRAYRYMVKKYHPDKSINKSPEQKNEGREKIVEINKAYDAIKKMRGIK